MISPWNFPLTLALIDAVPALSAGCAVIVKPSEVTPRFIRPLLAAIVTAITFVFTIFTPWAIVFGGAPIAIALTVWFWPKSPGVTPEPEID